MTHQSTATKPKEKIMLKISAKDQLTARAEAIKAATLMLEAACASTKTPAERCLLLRAISEATRLYIREAVVALRKEEEAEDEADLQEALEKRPRGTEMRGELREISIGEDMDLLMRNKRLLSKVSRQRSQTEGNCLHARSVNFDDDDEDMGIIVG